MIHPIGLVCIAIGLTFAMIGMVVVSAFSHKDNDDEKLPEIRITDEFVLGGAYLFQPLIWKPINRKETE